MNEDIKRLVEALEETTQRLTQAVGIVVEFGDLNGFRNLSDEELGKAVTQMAVAGTDTITRARQALVSLTSKETNCPACDGEPGPDQTDCPSSKCPLRLSKEANPHG